MIKLKRVYKPFKSNDGFRILIDRLWPRGLTKEKAKIDLWLKDLAPSNELRKWFGHDTSKWDEFQKRYAKELANKKEIIGTFMRLIKEKKVITLIFAAKDEIHNNAVALKKILKI